MSQFTVLFIVIKLRFSNFYRRDLILETYLQCSFEMTRSNLSPISKEDLSEIIGEYASRGRLLDK